MPNDTDTNSIGVAGDSGTPVNPTPINPIDAAVLAARNQAAQLDQETAVPPGPNPIDQAVLAARAQANPTADTSKSAPPITQTSVDNPIDRAVLAARNAVASVNKPQPTENPVNPIDEAVLAARAADSTGARYRPPAPITEDKDLAPQTKPVANDSTWDTIKKVVSHPLILEGTLADLSLPVVLGNAAQQYLDESGHPVAAKIAGVYAGQADAIEQAARDMTSPLNLALLGVTGGASAIENATVQALGRLASLGFSVAAINDVSNKIPEIKKAVVTGDWRTAANLTTAAAGSVAVAGMAGLHALGSAPVAGEEAEPVKPKSKNAPVPTPTGTDIPGAKDTLQTAPVVKIVDTDTAKTEAQAAQGVPDPTKPKITDSGLPVSHVVADDYLPTISKDQILSDSVSRVIENSRMVKNMLDSDRVKSVEGANKIIDDGAQYLEQKIDPRVGNRISWVQQKSTAKDMNLTEQDFLTRQSGDVWSAEKNLAAKAVLKDSTQKLQDLFGALSKGDDSVVDQIAETVARNVEIQSAIAGNRSEYGRGLQSLQMPDGDVPVKELAKRINEVPKETLLSAAKMIGGLDPDSPDFIRNVNKLSAELAPSSTPEKLFSVYRSMLLSSPSVLLKKGISEGSMIALEAMKQGAMGVAEKAKEAFGSTKSFDTGEVTPPDDLSGASPSDGFWYSKGALSALASARPILDGSFNLKNMFGVQPPGFEGEGPRAIKGPVGEAVRLPGTVIERETQLIWYANFRGSLEAWAAKTALAENAAGTLPDEYLPGRQQYLAEHPTKEAAQAADELARKQVFQAPLGKTGKAINNLVQSNTALKFAFPFVKTPLAIYSAMVDYSPWSALKGTYQGNLEVQTKGLLGSIIASAFGYAAYHGLVTGGGPASYPALKAQQDSGWQGYSIKIGPRYYQFNRAEPLGSLLGAAADIAHSQLKDEDTVAASKTSQFISHTARNLSSIPFLMNLSEIAEAISHAGDGKTAERILDNLAASMVVPSLVKNVAQTADNTVRDPQRQGITNPLPGLVQTIEERTPGLTKNVPPEINLQGEPRTRPASGLGGANPFPVSVQKPNFDVLNEMSRLGLTGAKVPLKPITIEIDGKSAPAPNSTPTADQAAAIEAAENKRLYEIMAAHVASPAWKNGEISDTEKKTIIKQVQRILADQGMVRLGRLRQLQNQEAQAAQSSVASPTASTVNPK